MPYAVTKVLKINQLYYFDVDEVCRPGTRIQCKHSLDMSKFMPRSHWAFLASPMHSPWKLTSIRRCSGGITEPSGNNLNSWYSWGSISPMPKIFNACFEIFHEPLAMFCREKCSANIRRWSATNHGIFAEQSPNIRRYFLIWDASANLSEVSAKHRRLFAIVSSFVTFWKTFAIFCSSTSNVRTYVIIFSHSEASIA